MIKGSYRYVTMDVYVKICKDVNWNELHTHTHFHHSSHLFYFSLSLPPSISGLSSLRWNDCPSPSHLQGNVCLMASFWSFFPLFLLDLCDEAIEREREWAAWRKKRVNECSLWFSSSCLPLRQIHPLLTQNTWTRRVIETVRAWQHWKMRSVSATVSLCESIWEPTVQHDLSVCVCPFLFWPNVRTKCVRDDR